MAHVAAISLRSSGTTGTSVQHLPPNPSKFTNYASSKCGITYTWGKYRPTTKEEDY